MLGLVEFIFQHIKRLQSPADDTSTQQWHDTVIALMSEDSFSAAAFFAVFLEDTLEMVRRIQQQIDTFMSHINTNT